MYEFAYSYREVIPNPPDTQLPKEININTGGTQSTLQDIKIAERANGYSYKDATKFLTRNRFIYWRANNDVLELVEESLDVNLTWNKIRYRFIDTSILDGISIHETYDSVIILVPTVCNVHRLIFPHPDTLHRQDDALDSHPDLSLPSIFARNTQNESSFYIFTQPSAASSQLPHAAASCLGLNEEAIFLLAYPSSELVLVKQQSNGDAETIELKYESIVPKFFSGIFRSKTSENNVIISMIVHTIGLDTFAITLCRDCQLRVWSCSKAQCVAVSDILIENDKKYSTQGAENHMLRKVVGAEEPDFIFGVYLNFQLFSYFDILKPIITGNQFVIAKIYSIHSPVGDLIDFSLTPNRIFSVLRDTEFECTAYTAAFNVESDKNGSWLPIELEALPNPEELPSDDFMDPRQLYLDYIFFPGRFPLKIISKALNIYKKSAIIGDVNLSAAVLKQRVCLAVENEIQKKLQEFEVNDDDYLETANWSWSRFYSCCVQYHVAGLRPLGILLLPSVSGAVLLKKSAYSFFRPLDILEFMYFCSDHVSVDTLYNQQHLFNHKEECSDFIILCNVLVHLQYQFNEVLESTLERGLLKSVSPNNAILDIISEITMAAPGISDFINEELNQCIDLYGAMHKLLELLRMDQPLPESNELCKDFKTSASYLFSSHLGTSIIYHCFSQQTRIKFNICKNLLIVQQVLLSYHCGNSMIESIRSVCLPEVNILLQSYFALTWLCKLTAATTLPLDAQMERLSCLKLSPIFNVKTSYQQLISLLELFTRSSGGLEAHKSLMKYDFDSETVSHWHLSLLPYLTQLTLIIWPINGAATFTEWLLSAGQHVYLQQYTELINPWCNWNNLTRSFLLAVAFLNSGESNKAYDLFLKCSKGVYLEQFIMDCIETSNSSTAFISYHLKVIQLFEMYGAKDYSIAVANAVLEEVEEDEPLKSVLHTIIFKHHLSLGHYNEAYDSLITNPDIKIKMDNLRDFIKTLLDKKEFDRLMAYNYDGMEELFQNVLFTRARAIDAVANIYYDFLYSYCVQKQFMRLAGSVMYEQAYRLNTHNTIEALEKQVKCLLASVNALYCIRDLNFAWVLKPGDPDLGVEEYVLPAEIGADEEPQIIRYKRDVDFIDLKGIRQELLTAKTRLQLARMDPTTVSNCLTNPQELVLFLCSSGIFKNSFILSKEFSLPYDVIFEFLTHQCIKLTEDDNNEAWNWLIENDLNDFDYIGDSPCQAAWTLLKHFLEKYEEPKLSVYHKVIASKILMMNHLLPHWLLASYKKRNPSELLRMYIFLGILDEAFTLAMDYLKAALGYGPEHFGLESSLTPVSKPLCLPVNIMDALVYELELQNAADPNKPFEKEHELLKELFTKYLETATRITYDVCNDKMSGSFFSVPATISFN